MSVVFIHLGQTVGATWEEAFMFCCGYERGSRKFIGENIVCFYLEQCPRCQTSKIALLENNVITKTHGRNARNLFLKFKPLLKEEKIILPKPSLSYIPLKYYSSVSGKCQKEMYSGCDVATGKRVLTEVRVFLIGS